MTVYTDHKNIMYDNFTTKRVLYWLFVSEEYGLTIKYIKVLIMTHGVSSISFLHYHKNH